MPFKVGDRVKYIEDYRGHGYKYGQYGLNRDEIYVVVRVSCGEVVIETKKQNVYLTTERAYFNLQLVQEQTLTPQKLEINNTIMSNLVSKFKAIIRTEPEKTFVKVGVLDESLNLTSDGKELFLNFLFEKNKNEFKTEVVDKIVDEEK